MARTGYNLRTSYLESNEVLRRPYQKVLLALVLGAIVLSLASAIGTRLQRQLSRESARLEAGKVVLQPRLESAFERVSDHFHSAALQVRK